MMNASGSWKSRLLVVPLLLAAAGAVGIPLSLNLEQWRQDQQWMRLDTSHIERQQIVDSWVEAGAVVVPYLIQSLEDPDPAMRRDAARALDRIGRDSREAVPALEKALGDPDRLVRFHAVLALGRIDQEMERLTPKIAALLFEGEFLVRGAAAETLTRLGTPAGEVVGQALVAAPRENCNLALIVLSHLGTTDPEVISAIRAIVHDAAADPSLREFAFADLIVFQALTIGDIESALGSGYRPLVTAGLERVREFGPAAAGLTGQLGAIVERNNDTSVRVAALEALGAIGPAARSALNAVRQVMNASPHPGSGHEPEELRQRVYACETWWKLGAEREIAVQELTALALDPGSSLTFETVTALREANAEAARRLLPTFVEWTNAPDGALAWRGVMGIKGLGRDAAEALPHVLRILRDPPKSKSTDWFTAETVPILSEIAPTAHDTIEALTRIVRSATNSTPANILIAAFDALGEAGPAASDEGVSTILEYLSRARDTADDRRFRRYWGPGPAFQPRSRAIDALRRIGVWNDAVREQIDAARNDSLPPVRVAALAACAALEPDTNRAVAALATALDDAHCLVRREAAIALGRLGQTAVSAEPSLRAALEIRENGVTPQFLLLPSPRALVSISLPPKRLPVPRRDLTVDDAIVEALRQIGGDRELTADGRRSDQEATPKK